MIRAVRRLREDAAAVALKEGCPLFDAEHGDKKDGEIVVEAFEPCGRESTGAADPGPLVHVHGLRLHPADEEKHVVATLFRNAA